MKLINTRKRMGRFCVIATTRGLQAAMMTLRGQAASDDEPSNEHPRSEQWLFVISGNGTATVIPAQGRRRTVKLRPGTSLLIERYERHRIKNSGRGALRTLNLYSAPAYATDGSVRRSARPE